jgi:hypothetical protein
MEKTGIVSNIRVVFGCIGLLICTASLAQAQADSVFSVQKSGVERFRVNSDGGMVASGVSGSGSIPASGAGVRLMWYPALYALRAGSVSSFGANYWDVSNVGAGSAAFGDNTRASGANSFAANLATTASGTESVALGNNGTASGDRSFAFNGTASGVGAVAIGSGAQATNDDALAMGPSSIAGGLAAITIGPSIANGNFGVAIGLQNSASGQFSVAIGKNARTANRQGSVVLGDGCAGFSSDSVYPTANNQFVARGCGGIKLYTNQGLTSGVEVAAGGSGWSAVSDRNRKDHFFNVDGEGLLLKLRSVPVTTWNYKAQDPRIRHMGAMAQDFDAAFGLGENPLMINSIDMDGVTLAGVKALDARTISDQKRIEMLEQQNADLKARVDALEQLKQQNAELKARLDQLEARIK